MNQILGSNSNPLPYILGEIIEIAIFEVTDPKRDNPFNLAAGTLYHLVNIIPFPSNASIPNPNPNPYTSSATSSAGTPGATAKLLREMEKANAPSAELKRVSGVKRK